MLLTMMAMIGVGLLLAKAAAVVDSVQTEASQEELALYLSTIKTAANTGIRDRLQQEISTTTDLFVSMHTAVALMQAATREFVGDKITMVAFTLEEVKIEKDIGAGLLEGKVIGGKILDSQKALDQLDQDNNFYDGLQLGKQAYFETLTLSLNLYLERALDKSNQLLVGDGFDAVQNLRQAIGDLEGVLKNKPVSSDVFFRGEYIRPALGMLRSILGMSNLSQGCPWFVVPTSVAEVVSTWKQVLLYTETLAPRIDALYGDANVPVDDIRKKSLSYIYAMLETSTYLASRIYDRLSGENGFEQTVLEFSEKLPEKLKQAFPDDKATRAMWDARLNSQAWQGLTRALHGVVAWQLLRQTLLGLGIAQGVLDLYATT
jgi:hypothetical protein